MSSKAIRVDIELVNTLQEIRATSETYPNRNIRPSFSAVIRKLIHDSQELRKIEQFSMSLDSTPEVIKFNHEAVRSSQKASKKSYKKSSNSIHLFCFDCQIQTPQRKLKTGEWKCSICGTKRIV